MVFPQANYIETDSSCSGSRLHARTQVDDCPERRRLSEVKTNPNLGTNGKKAAAFGVNSQEGSCLQGGITFRSKISDFGGNVVSHQSSFCHL
jgi:hypothetical protein